MATTITPTGQHNDQRRDAAGPRRRSGGAPLAHRKTAPLRPDSAPLLLRSGRPPTLDVVEVLLARENGFCFGVKKAVELTEAAAETGRPVHNLGQVVHNPKISQRLAARGVKIIKDPADAAEGIVVIRAHGVPPKVREQIEQRGLECIDATCSLVLRAQRFTKQLADEGYTVILLGGKNSANTRELVNLARMQGRDAYHIEDAKELQPSWVRGQERVGLIGGCSTPMDTLIEVKERIEALGSTEPVPA